MNQVMKAIANYKVILFLALLLAMVAGFQSYFQSGTRFGGSEITYTHYNNYIIFKQSFYHLLDDKDLYQAYPEEQWDLYKYSPTFSLFFGLFALFPDLVGLNLWNILNALLLLIAVYYLPGLDRKQQGLVMLIVMIEMMTSMQNEQSNALIAGLFILTFGLLEKQQYLFATLCIVFSVFVKIFGIVGLAIFLFYPEKWKLGLYLAGWTLVLFLLPLLVVSAAQLQFLYASWGRLLGSDHSLSYGYSVMGWLHDWFGFNGNKLIVVLLGMIIFLVPFVFIRHYKARPFRLLALSSVLLWVVIFNHKSESPTFVIAMAGIALWFVSSIKSKTDIFLFVVAMILTTLSPTDLFPKYLREEWVIPYNLKVLPCILIWGKIIVDMIFLKDDRQENLSDQKEIAAPS